MKVTSPISIPPLSLNIGNLKAEVKCAKSSKSRHKTSANINIKFQKTNLNNNKNKIPQNSFYDVL